MASKLCRCEGCESCNGEGPESAPCTRKSGNRRECEKCAGYLNPEKRQKMAEKLYGCMQSTPLGEADAEAFKAALNKIHWRAKAVVSIDGNRNELYIPTSLMAQYFPIPGLQYAQENSSVSDCSFPKAVLDILTNKTSGIHKFILNMLTKALNEGHFVNQRLAAFSFIYAYKGTDQMWHIDLRMDSKQYVGIVCGNKGPMISTVNPEKKHIEQAIGLNGKSVNTALFENNYKILENPFVIEANKVDIGVVNSGTMCYFKGGLVHAGPAHEDFRCVFFFTSTPNTLDLYDPNTQYHGISLLTSILQLDDISADEKERLIAYGKGLYAMYKTLFPKKTIELASKIVDEKFKQALQKM